ncbi:hypothetical protein C8J56DRAFT_1033648 [Mycena floridula]|nr:hypothetical protein C8J56DRAFT_1033648 [Mycena floridula]
MIEGSIEMAWMMGYIKHFDGQLKNRSLYVGWVDTKTDEPATRMLRAAMRRISLLDLTSKLQRQHKQISLVVHTVNGLELVFQNSKTEAKVPQGTWANFIMALTNTEATSALLSLRKLLELLLSALSMSQGTATFIEKSSFGPLKVLTRRWLLCLWFLMMFKQISGILCFLVVSKVILKTSEDWKAFLASLTSFGSLRQPAIVKHLSLGVSDGPKKIGASDSARILNGATFFHHILEDSEQEIGDAVNSCSQSLVVAAVETSFKNFAEKVVDGSFNSKLVLVGWGKGHISKRELALAEDVDAFWKQVGIFSSECGTIQIQHFLVLPTANDDQQKEAVTEVAEDKELDWTVVLLVEEP